MKKKSKTLDFEGLGNAMSLYDICNPTILHCTTMPILPSFQTYKLRIKREASCHCPSKGTLEQKGIMICDILFLLRVYNILLTTIKTGGSYFVQSIENTLQAFHIDIQVSFLYFKKKSWVM